ncbi:murein transglycosylase A [Roseibium sp.]|uniref:murein transglycosylase A n=1 Tax=Roseibium sp. TaxID=1936156 RepID=UPI003A9884E1
MRQRSAFGGRSILGALGLLLGVWISGAGVGAGVASDTVTSSSKATASSSLPLSKVPFSRLPGWDQEDHKAALGAFVRVCRKSPSLFEKKPLSLSKARVEELCVMALTAENGSASDIRLFFEREFTPHSFPAKGFLTGYFEPELAASRTRSAQFSWPLLKAPEDLVSINGRNRPKNWPGDLSHGRKTAKGIVPLPDRGAIMDGDLADENLEFVYLSDPVDAFFVHVQGSARLKLTDGTVMRVGYDGKAGYPYTSIARVLVERGEGTPEQLTASGLRQWLKDHPDQRDELFRQNRSFIFFREVDLESPEDGPIGAAGIPLVAGRSLAVDPAFIPYGAPVFVAADTGTLGAEELSFPRLVIADDTGSAIKGAARGDLFVGSGIDAGHIAGELRHRATMTVLLPNSQSSTDENG